MAEKACQGQALKLSWSRLKLKRKKFYIIGTRLFKMAIKQVDEANYSFLNGQFYFYYWVAILIRNCKDLLTNDHIRALIKSNQAKQKLLILADKYAF